MADNQPKKVGTPAQREVVVGAAARMLDTAGKSVQNLLNGLNDTVDELGLKIDQKTAQLQDLNNQYVEKERQAAIDMQQSLQARGLKAANELLGTYGMTSIRTEELAATRNELTTLKGSFKDDLVRATGAAANEAKLKWEGEKALLIAQNEKAAAEDKFALKGANDKIDMLEKQAEMLTKQLDDERKAGIERAKASSIGAVNVGGPANNR